MNNIKNEIVIYQPDEITRLEVRLVDETVWLTQGQMAELFMRDRTVITRHVNNVFSEGELKEEGNVHFLHVPFSDKPVKVYSLNVVISVGYRVKSLRGTQFRIWATNLLKEYLLRGYAFNQRFNQLEEKMDRRLTGHDGRLTSLEEKVDFFVQTSLPPVQGVFYNGQVFDAHVFVSQYILSAKKRIILIDNWVDIVTLEMLAKKADNVVVEIITSRRGNRLATSDIDHFNTQYGGLTVYESENFHDRFLIIDDENLYLVGASLKDLGRKCFAFTQLDPIEIPNLKARI